VQLAILATKLVQRMHQADEAAAAAAAGQEGPTALLPLVSACLATLEQRVARHGWLSDVAQDLCLSNVLTELVLEVGCAREARQRLACAVTIAFHSRGLVRACWPDAGGGLGVAGSPVSNDCRTA